MDVVLTVLSFVGDVLTMVMALDYFRAKKREDACGNKRPR